MSNLIQAFPHLDGVTADHNHTDVNFFGGGDDLNGIVEDDVHELIIPAEDTGDVAGAVELEVEALLHKFTQISGSAGLQKHNK